MLLAAGSYGGALASPTGLNTIPTTDIAPIQSWIAQLQNGNTDFSTPTLYTTPAPLFQNQFGITPRVEAGADYIYDQTGQRDLAFNAKGLLFGEDEIRPNAAMGMWNGTARHQPDYYITFSKTLNYDQEQRERFKAHHRRNRKLLGRRIHAGLTYSIHGSLNPFVGTDIQLNDSTVFQADWISGQGNALTGGFAYVMPDQRTVINPALLMSNDRKRIDGFFLNVSHQFNL